jgi:biopolymer transport protein ExbB
VYDFPALIRLNSGNFDFKQARNDGGDVMFTGSDNGSLPFEIERWDPVAGLAEAWVKIDTVHGNDSAQFILLYWGNPASTTGSNSAMVFDTTTGFQGVWHLGDAGDSVRDATANRYQGLSPDSARPSVAEGIIGNCREFDGAGDFVTMPNTATGKLNFQENGNFSVSAWVYADTSDTGYHVIAAKGYHQYYLWLTYFSTNSNKPPLWEFSNFTKAENWIMSNSSATEKQWVLLTGVRQGASQYLYCNGELVANISAKYPQGVARDTLDDFIIGRFLNEATYPTRFGYCHFKGKIDEVSVSSIARSPDWIRLSYMNQRSDDRLVQFK